MKMLWVAICVSGLMLSCTENIFKGSVDKNTDDALLYGAEKDIDANKYIEALTKMDLMSTGFRTRRDVKFTRASALAGACGLRFIGFFDGLSAIDFTPFFSDVMSTFVQTAATSSFCVQAEALVLELNTEAAISSDEQLFFVILSLSKMAAILRTNADVDGTANLGDGTADATFSSCSSDDISDSDVAQVVVGFSLFLQNFTILSTTLGSGSLDTTKAALDALCTALPAALCSATTEAAATPVVADMRKLLDTTAFGIGSCADPTTATCCP